MDTYNYYYIETEDGKYVYKRSALVGDNALARKFQTKVQAVQYAKKHLDSISYTVKGGGGLKEKTDYEYYQTRK